MKLKLKTLLYSSFIISYVLIFSIPTSASTLTVTNLNDNGPGSLRSALNSAVSEDIINFAVSGKITLTSGELYILAKNLTISGPGASNLSISGNNVSRVFHIDGYGNGLSVNLSDITIEKGNAGSNVGSGIYIGAIGLNLTLSNVEITDNVTTDRGAGIFISPVVTATISNSRISGNAANNGGSAIFNYGDITLTNVTIADNVQGCAFLNDIYSTASLTNVTVNGNSGGGICNSNQSVITLRNTIVANSTSGSNCSGSITSSGHNLESGNTCGFANTGDLINSNPHLGPLSNNGGPTQTCALLAASPAIDVADPVTYPATDQRGITRPQGSGPDIGAYEVQLQQLNILINGPGSGTVVSNPSGIDCGNVCSAFYMPGEAVSLTATPSVGGSIFYGWSGDADCNGGLVNMSSDISCTATFDLCSAASTAMTGPSGPFSSINAAYVAAALTDIIKIIASNQQEGSLVFSGKNVTLRGGYDCAFTEPPTSFTTITGSLTISGGSVTIGEGEIRIQ